MTAIQLFLELFPNADVTDRFGDYHTVNFDEFEKAFDRLSNQVNQIEEQLKALKAPHKCDGCGTIIYYKSYCDNCQRLWES